MRYALALVCALLLTPLVIAFAHPEEWVLQGELTYNFTVSGVVLSPKGNYIAVVYGDNYRSFVTVYNSLLKPLWTRQLLHVSSVDFANETLVVAVEQVYGTVPSTRVTLLDAETGREIYSGVIRGGFGNIDIVKTSLRGRILYILTRRELAALDIMSSREPSILTSFANSGLQMASIGEKLIVLSINTNCHICLLNNERTVTVVDNTGLKESKIYHVLLLLNLGGGSLGLLSDNGTILLLKIGDEIAYSALRSIQIPPGKLAASDPEYRLLFSVSISQLSPQLNLVNPSSGESISINLPLPYEKGDEIGLRGFDDGSFVAWSGDTVVTGNASSRLSLRALKPGFRVTDADRRGKTLALAGNNTVRIYSLQAEPTSNPLLVLDVRDEQGAPLENYTIIMDGNFAGFFSGSAVINASSGMHQLQVLAPGFQPAELSVNVTGKTGLLIVLRRVKFKLSIQAEEAENPLPEILLVKNSTPIARGVGSLTLNVPPGIYRVHVLGKKTNLSKTIEVRSDVEVFIYLVPYRVEITRNETTSRQEEIRTRVENLTVVIFGSESCPSCRDVKERLQRLGLRVTFRDISNRSNLDAYYKLYEILKAGSSYVIPLSLIFRGECIVAAVAGDPADPGFWQRVLSAECSNSAVVLRDDGSIVQVTANSSEVYSIVFGRGIPAEAPSRANEASLGVILALAAADSVNPCTFMVFAALLISAAGISGRRTAAKVAAAFIAAVFASYLLLGLGLVNFVGQFYWARYIVAAVVVAAGGYEVWRSIGSACAACRDRTPWKIQIRPIDLSGIRYCLEPLKAMLSTVEGWARMAGDRLQAVSQSFLEAARKGSVIAGAAAGVTVSFTLLPCSSGPYLLASYILSSLPFTVSVAYLLLYNIVFILPLVLIALAVIVGQRLAIHMDIGIAKLMPYRKYVDLAIGMTLIAVGLYILLLH